MERVAMLSGKESLQAVNLSPAQEVLVRNQRIRRLRKRPRNKIEPD